MSAASRGADAEREARKILEARGYLVVRSAASLGPVDLVAITPRSGVCLFVQVKRGRGRLRPPEWNGLLSLACRYGAMPVLAERVPRQPVRWFVLEGAKVEGGRPGPHQPMREIDPGASSQEAG